MEPPDLLFTGPEDTGAVVALAHGAGLGMDSPVLEALAGGLAAAGVRAVRFEFPYMQRARAEGRRMPPDPMERLEEAYRGAIAPLGPPEGLVLGGFSMGGRVASRLADGAGARGLVCVSYPFHPPGSPGKLRTAHLRDLRTPSLFVQGTRDPFGTPEEAAGFGLSPAIALHGIPDGDHQLRPRRSSGRTAEGNLAEAAAAAGEFVRGLRPGG